MSRSAGLNLMLIDVQDTDLNILLNGCFYAMALVGLLSLVPWPLRDGRNRWTPWLPLAALGVYVVYESLMPSRWNIRVDLLLIFPALVLVLATWGVRLFIVRRKPKGS